MLVDDNNQWDDSKILLTSLMRTCRVVNDCVTDRTPSHCGLLELLLFEIWCFFSQDQPYLCIMYMTMYGIGYYSLMRIDEISKSQHVLWACNVYMGKNKDKMLLILFLSKTHDVNV